MEKCKCDDGFVHIISLGAGVQSSTLALMASEGEITPRPLAAIFADTQHEPESVYKWLDYLETLLTFPVYRVTAGSLAAMELKLTRSKKSGKIYRNSKIPVFTARPAGQEFRNTKKSTGKGILPRRCTRDFKIHPVLKKAKELAELPRICREVRVKMWIGISTDEAHRMKPARVPWVENVWPLIDHGISRKDCLAYWEKKGLPKPPRSACTFCPYHSDAEWVRLKTEEPKEFAKVIQFEEDLRKTHAQSEVSKRDVFLHSSRQPLGTVLFDPKRDKADQFGNECEGMCGQ